MLSDERILGSGEFVERIMNEADPKIRYHVSINERRIHADKTIRKMCEKEDINIEELKGGSRRGIICQIRAQLAIDLVRDHGLTLAEAGRQLGVSTSAISKILDRNKKNST